MKDNNKPKQDNIKTLITNKPIKNILTFYENVFKNSFLSEFYSENTLIKRQLIDLSEKYSVTSKEFQPNHINEIILMRKWKVLYNSDNYFLNYFMKNHFSITNFLKNDIKENEGKFIFNTELSKKEIKDYIINSFHSCLKDNSITKNKDIMDLFGSSKYNEENKHRKMIETICVKERLQYYNFLTMETNMSKDVIKKYLNKKYVEIILNSSEIPSIQYDNKKLNDLFEVFNKN